MNDSKLNLVPQKDKFKELPGYLIPFIPTGKTEEFKSNRLKILNRAYSQLHLPPHYENAVLEDFPPNIKDKVRPGRNEDSRYIVGKPGTGKTHLIYALFKRYAEKSIIERGDCNNCVIIQVPKFLSILRSTYGKANGPSEAHILEDFTKGDYFFIDDLGAEKTTEWTIGTLYLLIDSLYSNNKTVFISSNLKLDDVADKLDERIASRIKGMCKILPMDGSDRR